MPIRAEVEGLGTLEFPDGTAESVIQATVKRELGAKAPVVPQRPGLASQFLSSVQEGLAEIPRQAGRLVSGIFAPEVKDPFGIMSPETTRVTGQRIAQRRADIAQAGEDIAGLVKPSVPLPPPQGVTENLVRGAGQMVGQLPVYRGAGRLVGGTLAGSGLAARAPRIARAAGSVGAFTVPSALSEKPEIRSAAGQGIAFGAIESAPISPKAKAVLIPLMGYLTARAGGATHEEAAGGAGAFAVLGFAPKVHELLKRGMAREAATVVREQTGVDEGEFLPLMRGAQEQRTPAPGVSPPPVPPQRGYEQPGGPETFRATRGPRPPIPALTKVQVPTKSGAKLRTVFARPAPPAIEPQEPRPPQPIYTPLLTPGRRAAVPIPPTTPAWQLSGAPKVTSPQEAQAMIEAEVFPPEGPPVRQVFPERIGVPRSTVPPLIPAPIQRMAAATAAPQPRPRPAPPDVAQARAVQTARGQAQRQIVNEFIAPETQEQARRAALAAEEEGVSRAAPVSTVEEVPPVGAEPAPPQAPKPEPKVKEPWEMTKVEVEIFAPPSRMGDKSRRPADTAILREEMGTLLDYADDSNAVRGWLGKGGNSATDVSKFTPLVTRNKPLRVYRATDVEDAIYPGAYVTPSRAYAEGHGANVIKGPHKILEAEARPDELVPISPNEFFYAPHDVGAWHKSQVEAALKKGLPVPPEVLKDYPDLARPEPLELKPTPVASKPGAAKVGPEPKGYSPAVQEGLKAWAEGRAYVDGAGNYHLRPEAASPSHRPRGPIAPWNKEVKRAFPDTGAFHEAAQKFKPLKPTGTNGTTLGSGLGVLGEKPIETIKGAARGIGEAAKSALPEEGVAEYARRSRAGDYLYRQFTRAKLPESKKVYETLDRVNATAERLGRNEEHQVAEVQRRVKLTNKEAELVSDVIEGKAKSADPRVMEVVNAVREVQGQQNREAQELGRKGSLLVTEPSGARRPYRGIGATYVPRVIKPEIKKALARDITKFFDAVRREAGEKAGRKLDYRDLLDSKSPAYRYIKEVAEGTYNDFIESKKTSDVTKQALRAMSRRGVRGWQALQALGEVSLDDVRLARAGHLEYARRSFELPPEFMERNIFKLLEQTLTENRRRLEVIKALGQNTEKLEPFFNAIRKKNPDEYLNVKQMVETTTGAFQRGKPAKAGRELFSQLEYLTKIGLGTATAAQLGQPGISTAAKHGLNRNLRAIFRLATEPGLRKQARESWGVNPHSLAETYLGYEGKGILSEVTKRLNKVNGFAGVNRAWNILDATSETIKLRDMAQIARKGSIIPGRQRTARNWLAKRGFDPVKDFKANGEPIDAEKVADLAFRSARDGQLQHDPLREPLKSVDKDTRFLYVLKRFTWKQFHRIKDNVREEYETHPAAVAPYLLRLAAYGYIGGEIQIQAKHLLNQFLHSGWQAATGDEPDDIKWWKEHDEENLVYDLIDRWASAGTLGMVTDLMRPGKEGRWTPWQTWRNLAFGLLPAAVGEGWRLGELSTEIGRKPAQKEIAEHGETGAWIRKAGTATGRYVKREIPLSRMFEEPDKDKKADTPTRKSIRSRRSRRRRRSLAID